MEIPNFSGDEDKYENSSLEWLRTIKKNDLKSYSVDEDTILYSTWENFEEHFSNKWIRDTKMEPMYRIQYELKEEK
jgi:hypothetical protein